MLFIGEMIGLSLSERDTDTPASISRSNTGLAAGSTVEKVGFVASITLLVPDLSAGFAVLLTGDVLVGLIRRSCLLDKIEARFLWAFSLHLLPLFLFN